MTPISVLLATLALRPTFFAYRRRRPHAYLPLRGRGSFLVPHDAPTLAQLQKIAGPLIRAKVRRLIGKACLRQQDRPDLEQEVWTQLWQRLRAYNSTKGRPHGFLSTVIDRILFNQLRERFAKKRDFRRVGSLHRHVVTDEGQAELGQTLSQQDQDVRHGRSARSDAEKSDLVQDVTDVIAQLPEGHRELAEQLQHLSLAEIARQQGVPRSTLQARVRKLRELFDRAGLRKYL